MDEKKSRIRVGIFVGTSLFLLLAALFYLGLSECFVRKAELVTTFRESVQGLNVGSDVKFRGVKIGTVDEITILVPQKIVKVSLKIDLKSFLGDSHASASVQQRQMQKILTGEIQQGLRCRMEILGITGMKFIDMDYFAPPGKLPPPPQGVLSQDDGFFVPSVNSPFKDVIASMTSALERIAQIRFEAISQELELTLASTRSLLSDPALKSMILRINEAAGNLERTSDAVARSMNPQRLEQLFAMLENNLRSFEQLTKKIDRTTDEMQLPASAQAFRDAAVAAQEAKKEVANTLLLVNDLLDVLRRFSEQMNYDPGYLIRGEKGSRGGR